ncbi:MAG: hypothetical protein AAB649_04245 [Patescibacteria group bacterium]
MDRCQIKDKILEYRKVSAKKNAVKIRERSSLWKKNNRDKVNAGTAKRRSARNNLTTHWTTEHWIFACNYFHNRCAVCDTPLDGLFHTKAADHWIPASSPECPGTVPWNMLPLCHGTMGCNTQKGSTDPVIWLNKVYGKRKANKILKKIKLYFSIVTVLFPLDV